MGSMLCTQKSKKGRVRTFLKKSICFILFLCFSIVLIYNFQIIPVLIPLTEAQTTTDITAKLQHTIRNTVASGNYTDFVQLRYGTDGSVVSLETNTAAIAMITGTITEASIAALCGKDRMTIQIPLGTLSGGALLTGRGPNISIPLAVSPEITCEIENAFYESGINLTLLRFIAEVEVELYALPPVAPKKIQVEAEYCIAETVIVGKVPDAYTKINRLTEDIEESDIDDIYDFGATLD